MSEEEEKKIEDESREERNGQDKRKEIEKQTLETGPKGSLRE